MLDLRTRCKHVELVRAGLALAEGAAEFPTNLGMTNGGLQHPQVPARSHVAELKLFRLLPALP